jgi:hypothetical protein
MNSSDYYKAVKRIQIENQCSESVARRILSKRGNEARRRKKQIKMDSTHERVDVHYWWQDD